MFRYCLNNADVSLSRYHQLQTNFEQTAQNTLPLTIKNNNHKNIADVENHRPFQILTHLVNLITFINVIDLSGNPLKLVNNCTDWCFNHHHHHHLVTTSQELNWEPDVDNTMILSEINASDIDLRRGSLVPLATLSELAINSIPNIIN